MPPGATNRVMPKDTAEALSPIKKRKNSPLPPSCSAFCTFVVFGIIVVPICVFAISAFFALILWPIECAEARELYGEDNVEAQAPGMCSFYEWWVYIVGNLVGVSVAEVEVSSSHVFAAVLDLLISVWSLTIAGLVIGLVGSLAWVNLLTESADSSLTGGFDKAFGFAAEARSAASATEGMDFDAFVSLCRSKGIAADEERLRELFDASDTDKSGAIDAGEVEKLIEMVSQEEASGSKGGGTGVDSGTAQMLGARMDAMDAKLDKILAMLPSVIESMDTPRAA